MCSRRFEFFSLFLLSPTDFQTAMDLKRHAFDESVQEKEEVEAKKRMNNESSERNLVLLSNYLRKFYSTMRSFNVHCVCFMA